MEKKNLSKEIKDIKKNKGETLELKHTISEIKNLTEKEGQTEEGSVN